MTNANRALFHFTFDALLLMHLHYSCIDQNYSCIDQISMPAQNRYASPKQLRHAPQMATASCQTATQIRLNGYGKPPKWLRQAQMATTSPQMARFINVTSLAMANFKRRQALVFAHDSSHANPLRFGSEPFDALFDRNVDRLDIGQF